MEALNLDNVICVNLKSLNNEQLFAICVEYGLDFKLQMNFKKDNILKNWVELSTKDKFILVKLTSDTLYTDYRLVGEQREAIKQIKPIKTPKIRKTPETLRLYKLYVEQGYDLYIPSLDQKLGLGKTYELVSDGKVELKQVSKSELENLMQEAVAEENYELAASLRDQLNSL